MEKVSHNSESHLLNEDAMTQILVLHPTIQKQHSHITDGFFIQAKEQDKN